MIWESSVWCNYNAADDVTGSAGRFKLHNTHSIVWELLKEWDRQRERISKKRERQREQKKYKGTHCSDNTQQVRVCGCYNYTHWDTQSGSQSTTTIHFVQMHVYANTKHTTHTPHSTDWLTDWPLVPERCRTAAQLHWLTSTTGLPDDQSINQCLKKARALCSPVFNVCVRAGVSRQPRSVRCQLGVTQRRSCQNARFHRSSPVCQQATNKRPVCKRLLSALATTASCCLLLNYIKVPCSRAPHSILYLT